jgi:hypothetical protein
MKNYKVYWNEPTVLKLTEKASAVHECTDPLEIREFCHEHDVEDEDGNVIDVEKTYTYDLIGSFEAYNLTAEEVNEMLEEEYDSMMDWLQNISKRSDEDDRTVYYYTIVKETICHHEDGWNTPEELERLTTFTDEIEARKEAYLLNRANTEDGIFYSIAVEPRENGVSLGEWHIEAEDLMKIRYYFD